MENGNTRTVTELGVSAEDREFPSVRISLELNGDGIIFVLRKIICWVLFPKDRMPEPGDIPQETIGEFDQPNDEKFYYKTDDDYLYLSVFGNWVFTNLDRSFDEAFGDHSHIAYRIPKRPLYVYSNAGRSVITGDKVTDLLREVPYNPEEIGYERKHIQYIPLRSDVIDIIEVQVSESDGSLVTFDPGVTVVTLHFKQ